MKTALLIALGFLLGLVLATSWPVRAQSGDVNGQSLFINMGDLWRIESGSMAPTLNMGDQALVLPYRETQLKPMPKTVITYKAIDGTYVTHRIVETGTDEYGWWAKTKGDALPNPDPFLVREKQLVGRVLWRITMWP